jgi:TolB protein
VSRGSWDEDNAEDPQVVTGDLLKHWWTTTAAGRNALRAFHDAGFRRGRVKYWTGVSGDGQANAEVLALLFRDRSGAARGLHALDELLRREPPEAGESARDVSGGRLGDESWGLRFTAGDETLIYGLRLGNLVVMAGMVCVDDAGCSPTGALDRTAWAYADDLTARAKHALAREHPARSTRDARPPLVSAVGSSGLVRAGIRGTIVFDVTAEVPGKYEAMTVSQIYAIGGDGKRLRRLTPATAINSAPTWSPDGTRIAYLSYRSGLGTTLWTMNADGSGKTRLGRYRVSQSQILGNVNDYGNFLPRWSTDGKAFVFTRDAPSRPRGSGVDWGKSTIWVVPADGSHAHAVTRNFYAHGLNDSNDVLPSWSPDGKWIAFERSLAIWIARPDGTRAHVVMRDVGGFPQGPAWSPNGKWIAYVGSNGSDLFVVRPDGSGKRLLTDTGSSNFAWSPDGRRLAFTDCPSFGVAEACRVAVIPIVKGRKIALTRGGPDWVHAWSPDGRAIAYIRPSDSGETLNVVTVDRRVKVRIAKVNNPGGQVGLLTWQPG